MNKIQCSPNMWINGEKNCKYWERICFSESGIFNDDGEMIGEEHAQWGICTKLTKEFRYVIGSTPLCEPIQSKLI